VLHLRNVGAGCFGTSLVAPNTMGEFASVVMRLRDIESHPFIQVNMLRRSDAVHAF
jgi:hypothetical protein